MLLDGPESLIVHPGVASTDDLGNPVIVPSGATVTVVGQVQPVSAEEANHLGQQAKTIYRYIGRTFPLGPFSRVEWQDREWDVVGDPKRTVGSVHTSNVTVILRSRTPEIAPEPPEEP